MKELRERRSACMMTYDQFNRFCAGLPATTHVVQWGGAHVWKVGGKVFAIGGWQEGEPRFTFKVNATAFEILKEMPGLRPAPYLASRGLQWIQHFARPGLSDAGLKDYIAASHRIVAGGLARRTRIALGLETPSSHHAGVAPRRAHSKSRRPRGGSSA